MKIEVKNLSWIKNNQTILNNISFEVPEHSWTVLMGANGAGKSSLLKVLSGIEEDGEVTWNQYKLNGKDMTMYSPKERAHIFGIISQSLSHSLISELTLLENFVLYQRKGLSKRWSLIRSMEKDYTKMMAQHDYTFAEDGSKKMEDLSGGQRQILINLWMLHSPVQILCLDEHTSALDPQNRDVIMTQIHQTIQKRKMTILMVTHDIEHALKYGDQLMILEGGQVKKIFSYDEKKTLKSEDLMAYFGG